MRGKNGAGATIPKIAPNTMLITAKIITVSMAIAIPPSQPVLKLAL